MLTSRVTLKFRSTRGLRLQTTKFVNISKMCGREWRSSAKLNGKTAIITGSNTGLGRYNVRDFYKRGCDVIMACRDVNKATQTKVEILREVGLSENAGSIIIQKLDLSSLTSVRKFAEAILKKVPKIHILVNNAGVMGCPRSVSEDGIELQFATNYLGHFLLTILLLPRMIESAPARIINVSSVAHAFGKIHFDDINSEKKYSPSRAYAQSKLANILFTKELARRLEGKGVTVYAVHPGLVRTEIDRHMKVKWARCSKMYSCINKLICIPPERGVLTQLYCALDEKVGKQSGLYYSKCRVTKPSCRARNRKHSSRLWDLSLSLVGMEGFDPLKPIVVRQPSQTETELQSEN